MKFLRFFQFVCSLLVFTAATQAKATCWWQWEGINSAYVCDGCGSGSCSTLSSSSSSEDSGVSTSSRATMIAVKNECFKHGKIWVGVHFRDTAEHWQNAGWYGLVPGQTAFIGLSHNSIFYVTGRSDDGTYSWRGSAGPWTVRGESDYYRQINAAHRFDGGTYTDRLICP